MIFNKGLIKSTMAFLVLVCASMFYSISSQAAAAAGTAVLTLMVDAVIPPSPGKVTTFTAYFVGSGTITLTDPYQTGTLTGNDFKIQMIGGTSDKEVAVYYSLAGLPTGFEAEVKLNGMVLGTNQSKAASFTIVPQEITSFTGNVTMSKYDNEQKAAPNTVHTQVTFHLQAKT